MNEFKFLSKELFNQLSRIEPSKDGFLKYYPCKAMLKDNSEIDRVYIVDQKSYIKMWGVYPEDDKGKYELKIEEIKMLIESPTRLPAKFANKLYKSAESGMGYTIFTVNFNDGTRLPIITGNAIDFIEYPDGKGPKDVKSISCHEGRNNNPRNGPKYYWCIYSGIEKYFNKYWKSNSITGGSS